MAQQTADAPTYSQFYSIETSKAVWSDGGDMGKEERKQIVLNFMAEYRFALPPKAIFRNLKLHENITFSEDSVENYLVEFVEDGLVERVQKEALDAGEIQVAGEGDERAWYLVTDRGVEQSGVENSG